MAVRVGINGFGRIGRQSLKAIIERAPDVEVVAVNDLVDAEMNALLFKYDSTYGAYPGEVRAHRGRRSSSTARDQGPGQKDPAAAAVGRPRRRHRHRVHRPLHRRRQGAAPTSTPARRRSSSAPRPRARTSPSSSASTRTAYDPAKHHIISNAVLHHQLPGAGRQGRPRPFGIERGLMTTDPLATPTTSASSTSPHKDLRRARAAALNIIPTTTGAAKALALVIPELKGKFDGFSLRVPTPTVSVVDFTANVEPSRHGRGAQRRLPRPPPRAR